MSKNVATLTLTCAALACSVIVACGEDTAPDGTNAPPPSGTPDPGPQPGTPPGPSPGASADVLGAVDGIDAQGVVAGWALGTATPNDFIDVKLYADGPKETGKLVGVTNAWRERKDVNQALGVAGDHGFEFLVPEALRDDAKHTIYAYGVGPKGEVLIAPQKDFKLAPPFPKHTGKVRLDGKALVDDDGPFNALGATLFAAPRWFKFDRPRLERNLEFLARSGFDYIRVLGEVGWAGREIDPRWPDYRAVIDGLTDLAFDKYGIRVQWTIFGGTDFSPTPADRLALVDEMIAMSRGREQKLIMFEIANEYWQNGFGGDAGRAELRSLSQHAKNATDVLVAASAPAGGDDQLAVYQGGVADVATLHLDRTTNVAPDGPWRTVRQPWGEPNDQLGGMVAADNEPIGPGSSVASDRDPTRLVMSAVTAYVSQLPFYVYHSRAGVGIDHAGCASLGTCDLGGDKDLSQMPASDAFRAMKRYMPAGIENWTRQNHYWAGHPFRTYGDGQENLMTTDGAQNGVMRAYAAVSPSGEFIVALSRIVGTLHLEAKAAMKVCAIEPTTGALVGRWTLAPNQGLDLSGHPGLVLRGKNGGADDGCRTDWGASGVGSAARWDSYLGAAVHEPAHSGTVNVPDATWANILVTNDGNTPWADGDVKFDCRAESGNWTFELRATEAHTVDFKNWRQWPVQPGETVGLRPVFIPKTATPQGQSVTATYTCQLMHGTTPLGPRTRSIAFKLMQP